MKLAKNNPFRARHLVWPIMFEFAHPDHGSARVTFFSPTRVRFIVPGLLGKGFRDEVTYVIPQSPSINCALSLLDMRIAKRFPEEPYV